MQLTQVRRLIGSSPIFSSQFIISFPRGGHLPLSRFNKWEFPINQHKRHINLHINLKIKQNTSLLVDRMECENFNKDSADVLTIQ